jgi:hypothetical protein
MFKIYALLAKHITVASILPISSMQFDVGPAVELKIFFPAQLQIFCLFKRNA